MPHLLPKITLPRPVTARRWPAFVTGAAISLAAAPLLADMPGAALGPERIWLADAAAQGGEGGEAGKAPANEAEADAAYIAALATMEGALEGAVTLYLQGEAAMAAGHMKRSDGDAYLALAPELAAKQAEPFAAELDALADAVAAGAPGTEVQAAFDTLRPRLQAARVREPGARHQFDALLMITREAADDYAAGVTAGRITDLPEYQDAFGYMQIAARMAEALTSDPDAATAAAATKALAAIRATGEAFAGLTPTGIVPGDVTILQGAAARIELAALKVR